MAVSDQNYSRLVKWLKIALPLSALAILSSLFLVSRTPGPTIAQPTLANGETAPAYQPQISNPSLSGVTKNGATYTLRAKLAIPGPEGMDRLFVSEFAASISGDDGFMVDITAPKGIITNSQSSAVLSQGVNVITADGYHINSDEMNADLANTILSTPGEVTAFGPLGELKAGQMTLRQQSSQGAAVSYELVFKNGVNVIYNPKK